jgi:hypothetical protein
LYIAYLNAKNTPTTNPGIAMITDTSESRDRNTARTAQASEAIMSIRIADFVTGKSHNVAGNSIKVVF